jgi:hypothetical protein
MKQHTLSRTLLALTLLILGNTLSNAATLSLDLDIHTPGIQNSLTLNQGSDYQVGVVFTGDGTTQFDTFALDLVHGSAIVDVHNPTAGAIADSAPLMAFDIYGATQVNSGDTLTQGSMPAPLGYDDGLGGIGVSSLGGMPFPLLGEDETVGLFSASLSALRVGTGTLALTGYPFGIGAGLSLAGAPVPVTLEGATVTVVPVPPALWLFATGALGLLGVGRRKGVPLVPYKIVPHLSLLCALALLSPLGFAVPQDSDADLNGDAMLTSQDISILANCYGQDPASNSDCAKADVDEDGDIDGDDFSFASARLGLAYPETLFQEPVIPPSYSVGDSPQSSALGDVNGDGVVDVVTANRA